MFVLVINTTTKRGIRVRLNPTWKGNILGL